MHYRRVSRSRITAVSTPRYTPPSNDFGQLVHTCGSITTQTFHTGHRTVTGAMLGMDGPGVVVSK